MTNQERASRCAAAISEYGDDLPEPNLVDFLADAMHFCRSSSLEFDRILGRARMHFEAEHAEAAEAAEVDAAHDRLSDLLEDPDAGNDDIRDAAVDLCAALLRHRTAGTAAITRTKGKRI